MICDSNDVVEQYGGKKLHCTGVLLRADITGHSQISQFTPKKVGWPCSVRSSIKRTGFQVFFHNVILCTFVAPHVKELKTYFFIFLDFRIVWTEGFKRNFDHSPWKQACIIAFSLDYLFVTISSLSSFFASYVQAKKLRWLAPSCSTYNRGLQLLVFSSVVIRFQDYWE